MDDNTTRILGGQKKHLASLLEAMQRCVYFLHASDSAIPWPLSGDHNATALRFVQYSDAHLHIQPEGLDFSEDFHRITAVASHHP